MATQRHQNALPNGYLFEGYRIEGVLGAGSFGVTYKAREVAIDRLVAIKEYMPAGIATRDPQQLLGPPDLDGRRGGVRVGP